MITAKKYRGADLFCGAGGSTTGAIQAGVDVVLAINHWRTAIYTHQDNYPGTRHICARIDDIDPRWDRDLPEFDVLMASPECTHHSVARGGRPVEDQKRATPWHVVIWAEAKQPRWIIVENVPEFRDWGPLGLDGRPNKSRKGQIYQEWLRALRVLGYHVEDRLLNAADYGEATKRNRLFVIARKGFSSAPIKWPRATHGSAAEIAQQLAERHRCNLLHHRAAAEVIDWGRPCPSIFGRKRPLADKTLKRIEIGLRKFAAQPFNVRLRNSRGGLDNTVKHPAMPLSTITAGGKHHGLAVPFVVKYHGGTNPRRDGTERSYSPLEPLPTLDTQPRFAVASPLVFAQGSRCEGRPAGQPMPTLMACGQPWMAVPFVYSLIGRAAGRSYSPGDPLPTIVAARENHGVCIPVPYLMDVNHGGAVDRSYDVRNPLGAVTTKRGKSLILPFLTTYFGTGGPRPVDEPLSTMTAKQRHGLAMVSLLETMGELGVVDIGFRMLDVDELSRAQGFPEGYHLHGNKAEQIRQVGNAVCPGVMRAICESILN